MLRWWWPGGAVDSAALCEQLRQMVAAGWGGAEIQPLRVGLPHGLPGVHEVFTPQWWATLDKVLSEAARLGMQLDLTFGSCWPFGGGEAITPELATQEVTLAWTSVTGPCHFKGRPKMPQRPERFGARMERDHSVDDVQALPDDWRVRMDALARVEAVLAVRGGVPSLGPFAGFVPPLTLPDAWGDVHASGWVDAQAAVDLTDRLQVDGTLDWDVPPGDWQIVSCVRFVSDQRITEGAGHGPQLVLDHLKREAFDAHARRVGDAGWSLLKAHAGKALRAVFVDSLEIPTDILWTDDFAAEFERRRGYAPRPYLPLLLQPGWRNCFQARVGAPLFDDPEVGPRVRADYRCTVSELMIERLYAPLAEWADAHGMQAKTQAHGAPVDWLQAYGSAHIPETEDLAGGAAAHFVRVARSAAHLYGRPLVSAEAFCFMVEGFAVTPQQLRERADEFYVHGVQQIVGHGAAAGVATSMGPAGEWYPFEAMEFGTSLAPASPLMQLMKPLADYMARCQAAMQRGSAVVPVAVLAPLDLFAFVGAAGKLTPEPWHDSLLDAGLDWDWINGDALLKGRIEPGALVTPGGHRYQALLLPALPALRAEVAERLREAAQASVQVLVVGSKPGREEGWLDARSRDQRVRAALAEVATVTPSSVGRALRAAGLTPVLDLPPGHGLQFTVREEPGQRWIFLRNPDAEARRVALPVPAAQGLELWHTWTGRRERLPAAEGEASLTLAPGSARLLRLAPLADAMPVAPMLPLPAKPVGMDLPGPWSVQARGRGLGGRAITFDAIWPSLRDLSQDPDAADFAGQLNYHTEWSLTAEDLSAGPLWLDLGQVFDAAQVQVNDAAPVTACEAPFLLDLHRALKLGLNRITITVANRPENAHRDPARPGGLPLPGRRLTRLPTGLLGPVRCVTATASATRWSLPL